MMICILTLGFSGSNIATTGIGRATQNPARDFFTSPDGSMCAMPCLFGIRAGYTTVREAVQMIRAHPLTKTLMFIPSRGSKYNYFNEPAASFIGNAGQIVFIKIYSFYELTNSRLFEVNFDPLDEIINAVRIGSYIDENAQNIPKIPNALRRAWQSATFTAIEEILQTTPKATSHFFALGRFSYPYAIYLESFYFKGGLIVTHFPAEGIALNRLIDKNPLSSLVILDIEWHKEDFGSIRTLRLYSGYAGGSFIADGTWQQFWQLHDDLLRGVYPNVPTL